MSNVTSLFPVKRLTEADIWPERVPAKGEAPRAFTKEEAREIFVDHMKGIISYWAEVPNQTDYERCEGVMHSVLTTFDGNSLPLPALDIVVRPHQEDKPYAIDHGMNYFEDGTVLNDDCSLRTLIFKVRPKLEKKTA